MNARYKLICWNGHSIPVWNCMKWLAMDKDGTWYIYEDEPIAGKEGWQGAAWMWQLVNGIKLEPPEEGDWTEQLYYIG